MRLYVICDNEDTYVGLRLAGVEGRVVPDRTSFESVVAEVSQNKDIGIILINRSLMAECGDYIQEFRKKHSLPLLVEVPDTSGKKGSDSIARYVREAVGIKE